MHFTDGFPFHEVPLLCESFTNLVAQEESLVKLVYTMKGRS